MNGSNEIYSRLTKLKKVDWNQYIYSHYSEFNFMKEKLFPKKQFGIESRRG